MLVPKKIRIVEAETAGLPSGLVSKLIKSATEALEFEKSLIILENDIGEQPTDQADYIMPIGAVSPAFLQRINPCGFAQIVSVPAPDIFELDLEHTLAIGESLHGYFAQNDELIGLYHLPKVVGCSQLSVRELTTPAAQEHRELAAQIHTQFKLQGPWHVVATGRGKLEIHSYAAPYFTSLFSAFGANWYALLTFEAANKPVAILEQPVNGQIILEPGIPPQIQFSFRTLYLDLDDTLIIHGAINPHAMRLLLECNQLGIDVHLITRHAGNLPSTLEAHNIDEGLFTSVIWIKDKSPKSSYMNAKNTIFIDDSFQERKDVSANRRIPSFSPEAIKILFMQFGHI